MGQQELSAPTFEARKARVLQALRVLSGDGVREVDPEEQAVLCSFRELRETGYGRLEVILHEHQVEGINTTRTRKRRELSLPTRNCLTKPVG